MERRIPDAGEGIAVSALSGGTSRSGSSTSARSPSFFSQRVTVPSVTLSPSCGMDTETDILVTPLGVEVQGLAGQREVRFADDLGLGRGRGDKLGGVGGLRRPVVDQLALGDGRAAP